MDGKTDLAEANRRLDEGLDQSRFRPGRPEAPKPAGSFNFTNEQAKREHYKALLAEIEYRTRQGELLEAEAVEQAWSAILFRIRAKLLALPSKMAPRLTHYTEVREIKDALDQSIRTILAELAKPPAVARDPRGARTIGTAAEAHAESVG